MANSIPKEKNLHIMIMSVVVAAAATTTEAANDTTQKYVAHSSIV